MEGFGFQVHLKLWKLHQVIHESLVMEYVLTMKTNDSIALAYRRANQWSTYKLSSLMLIQGTETRCKVL